MKRLTSLDFWRGIAIFFTAMFHFLFTSWDKFSDPNSILGSGNIGLILLAAFIFIFIHWRGFFLMISAVVNFYQLENAVKNGKNLWGVWGKQLFAGLILILVGKLWVTVFPYWGFVEIWSRQIPIGSVPISDIWASHWDMFFLIEAIESIGLMMIVTSFFFLLFQLFKGKYSWMIKMAVCYVIGIVIIAISPIVGDWATNVVGIDITMLEGFRAVSPGVYFHDVFTTLGDFFNNFGLVMYRVAMNWISGREAPLFPMMASYFFGAGIAYVILQDEPKRKHLRWMCLPSLLAVIWGAAEFLFIHDGGFLNGAALDLGFHIHPRWFAFVSFGLQAPLILALLSWVEFNPRINEQRWLKGTRWIRRFGVFALTVYFLGILDFILRFLMSVIVPSGAGADFISRYGLNAMWTWITVAILMLIWTFGLFAWDRIARGYGSFEFFLSLLKIPKAGRKRDWKDPIGLRGSLWDVEMVSYVK
ncbi:MAG: hypothetical protein JW776_05650 [Candidatus Lokiarchaeota archaeon]|nr:hypothetical protein [Candidatus Lokiarchaeota archaeon]